MLDWNRYGELVVLTGAGISVASGLGTYRGPGGLWEESGVAKMATAEGMAADPWGVWQFFNPLIEKVQKAQPNPAHLALAELEKKFQGEFTLVTQNVDGLHSLAGNSEVVELHGNILRRRCTSTDCAQEPYLDPEIPSSLPLCSECGSPLRPDIILFGEQLPALAIHRAKRSLRTVELFLSIGTSGTVLPAANFVRSADYAGALTVEVNLQSSGLFAREFLGPAEKVLPKLIKPL